MFCDQCGATVAPGAKFCEECGVALGGATVRQTAGLSRSLKGKSWTWLLLAVGSALLLIVGGRLLTFEGNGSGGKGSLSKKEAARKIQVYSEKVHNEVIGLSSREANTSGYAGAFVDALVREGYLQHDRGGISHQYKPHQWGEMLADALRREHSQREKTFPITEKGKPFLEETVTPRAGRLLLIHRADFRSCCEITGITTDPGGVEAKVHFTVKASEPYKILRKVQRFDGVDTLKGEAQFRRYDDGWRVESAKLED
jgi:hypothetical protein